MTGRMVSKVADRWAIWLLLAVHAVLLAWAIAGFTELLVPAVPWPRLSNPLFSPALLLLHWTAIAAGGATFLFGYALRWRLLPQAMTVCYAGMAAICALETFSILEHASRFLDMALEYVTYVAILAYLFLSPAVGRRIGPRISVATA